MNQVESDPARRLVKTFQESCIPLGTLCGVSLEADLAHRKHPFDPPSERRFLIAMEEVGETAQAMLEGRLNDAIVECDQTAAMFLRLAAKLRQERDARGSR